MIKLNPDNIAQHLISLGYSAKAGTITDKKSGDAVDVVFINGLGSINAYLSLSPDPAKFGLKVFGNLQEGYAPVVLDGDGEVVRETVTEGGQSVTRAKRGQSLDAASLKRKNDQISITARKEITGAVIAAYMLEASGGDLGLLKDGFRLQKWERSGPRNAADGDDAIDASGEFAGAAAPEAKARSAPTAKRAQGPIHP